MKNIKRGQIYKITYPNGKIYVGQDRTDDINYFGSACSEVIARDFTRRQRRSMTVTKEIIEEVFDVTIQELNKLEAKHIAGHHSCDPKIGYNRSPRGKRK
jgi:putative N-acetylmannosamine-6-phosphate epimerase